MTKATLKVVSMNIATKECKSRKTFSTEVQILGDMHRDHAIYLKGFDNMTVISNYVRG